MSTLLVHRVTGNVTVKEGVISQLIVGWSSFTLDYLLYL